MRLCALALIWTLNDLRDNLDFSLALLFVGALYRCYACIYISFSIHFIVLVITVLKPLACCFWFF